MDNDKKKKLYNDLKLIAFAVLFFGVLAAVAGSTGEKKKAAPVAAKQAEQTQDISGGAFVEIRRVIRFNLGDVKFEEATYNNQFGNVFETKYRVKRGDTYIMAFAKVKYLGGDIDDTHNWEVLETTFE